VENTKEILRLMWIVGLCNNHQCRSDKTYRKKSYRQAIYKSQRISGGQKFKTPAMLLATKPAALLENSIKGMLPKNRLGREIFRNLHVYAGPEHPMKPATKTY